MVVGETTQFLRVMTSKRYHAKLLLLGEYTVMLGGDALAVPLSDYYGNWVNQEGEGLHGLAEFVQYLATECADILDLALIQELSSQYKFTVNIPIGYGLGSSGALVAGIYDVAARHRTNDPAELMEHLGRIESFFHGKSSGFDPLVSYLNSGILKQDSTINSWDQSNNELVNNFSLADSGRERKGKGTLIPAFLKWAEENPEAVELLKNYQNQAIGALLHNDEQILVESLKFISDLQWTYLQDWITPSIKSQWWSSDEDIFKICGAGGGGYYLKYSTK